MSDVIKSGLVSVVVASHNHAEYLEQRMDSLINQTYQDIEILVIDDCSTDGSVEVLRKYESHPKVRLIIREKNAGWVAVSNQGVAMSSGKFIIFANCDDSCGPQMIERLVNAMYEHPSAGISFCRSFMIDEDGKLIGDDFLGREKTFKIRCNTDALLNKNEMSRFLLHSCVIPNLSAALFRKESYMAAGGLTSSYRVCSDWALFFKVVENYDVAYVAQSLNEFRQHKTTIRSSTKERILYEEIIGILLRQITLLDLTFVERMKYRLGVMFTWAVHLLSPSFGGILSFTYLLRVALRFDAIAIVYLPLALILRLIQLPLRVLNKIYLKLFCVGKRNLA
jgi:glycosyltransferase involved in cell wall biosynthesis